MDSINKKRTKLHSIFRFPGSFHAPLVNSLLKKNDEKSVIGDPMCGSGTVALEGITKGKYIINMDIDPLSCLITKVKSNPIDPEELSSVIDNWFDLFGYFPLPNNNSKKLALNILSELESETKYQRPHNVFHWFDPYVVIALAKSLHAINKLNYNIELTQRLESIIASIIRRVSRADPQPVSGLEVTKIMDALLIKGLAFNVRKELIDRSKILLNGYGELITCDDIGKSITVNGDVSYDWKNYCRTNSIEIELVITSPPYCNAINYSRRHRLEYFWLGLLKHEDIIELSRNFLGSISVLKKNLDNLPELNSKKAKDVTNKLKNDGKLKKSLILKKYFIDAEKWIAEMMDTLTNEGVAYIIVGPSTSYGYKIDTPEIFIEIIELLGYKQTIDMRYGITNHRMRYLTGNDVRIKTETVLKVTQ